MYLPFFTISYRLKWCVQIISFKFLGFSVQCVYKINRFVCRHFSFKWHKEYNRYTYDVCIIYNLYPCVLFVYYVAQFFSIHHHTIILLSHQEVNNHLPYRYIAYRYYAILFSTYNFHCPRSILEKGKKN